MSTEWWDTEENDEVATKPELWRPLADAVDGFDLDPAAGCEPTPIATDRYTPEDDGLATPWYGTVWLNPPFGDKPRWFRRLVTQYRTGDVVRAVAVSTVDTSADWFHESFSTADVLGMLDGRNWYHTNGRENFASMVGVWNPTDDAIDTLRSLGTVVEPMNDDPHQTTL